MAKVQLVYINRSTGNGTGGAPAATYDSYVLDEGNYSLPADGKFKTVIIIPIEEDVYIAVGQNPDVSEEKQQILVPLGNTYEVALGIGQRFAVKASGTKAGAGAGGGGGSGGVADTVKIDATGNTIKIDPAANTVKINGTVPVSGPLTDVQIRATPLSVAIASAVGPLDVSITAPVDVVGPLTNTQLRATAVPVSGTVTATGPLTNTQLRATPIDVSGPLTYAQLTSAPIEMNMVAGHFRALPSGVNRSGQITTADVWQVVAAADTQRTAFSLQSITSTEELFITEFDTASLTSDSPGVYRLQPGQVFWALSNNKISILGKTVGLKWSATETGYE